jgi:hypothetical protein
MIVYPKECVDGCGNLNGSGDGSGEYCYGFSNGRGIGISKVDGFSPDGTYFEHNSKYFGLHPVGEGYSGQQHLNVSYDHTC